MKLFLRVIVSLFVLAVAVTVAGIAIVASLDPNEYREQISAEAKAATGRKLTLKGDLHVGISLVPTIIANDVTFANAVWGSRTEMASIKKLEATLEILPLLSGEVRIRKIVLVEPDILFEVSSDGRPNWDFGGVAESRPAAAAESVPSAEPTVAPESAPTTFPAIESLTIDKAKFHFNDMKSNEKLTLSLDRVRIDDAAIGKKLKIDIKGDYNGTPFQIRGTTDSVDRFMADGRNFSLDLDATALAASAKIKGVVGTPMSAPHVGVTFSLTGKDLSTTLSAAKAVAPQLGNIVLPEIGSYDVSGRATGLASAPTIENFRIALGSTDAFKLNGTGKGTTESVTLDSFELEIYGSDLSGNLSAALGGTVPAIKAALSSRNFDLADIRRFLDVAKEKTAAESSSVPAPTSPSKPTVQISDERVFSADPLPLDKLKGIDAQISFRGNRVAAEGLTLNVVDVNAGLEKGKLNLDPFGATVSEGRISGKVSVDGATSGVIGDVTVDKLNLGKLLKDRDVTDILTGTASAKVNVRANGDSVRALMASLTGSTEVIMDEGRLANGYLDMLAADLLKQVVPGAAAGEVKINCFVSRFDITQGVATSKALLLDTGRMTVTGGGTIDLGTERLKLGLDPQPKDSSLISLAVPLEVTGTLTSPRVAPTTTAVLKGLAGFAVTGLTPVGILAALARKASGEQNPCLAALNSAPQGQTAPANPGQPPAKDVPENKTLMPVNPSELLRGLLGGAK